MTHTAALLAWLLTTGGCSAAIYGLIRLAGELAPATITPNVRFYGAMLLAFVLPIGAFAGEVAFGLVAFNPDGVLFAITVSYMVSQGIHRVQTQQAALTFNGPTQIAGPVIGGNVARIDEDRGE